MTTSKIVIFPEQKDWPDPGSCYKANDNRMEKVTEKLLLWKIQEHELRIFCAFKEVLPPRLFSLMVKTGCWRPLKTLGYTIDIEQPTSQWPRVEFKNGEEKVFFPANKAVVKKNGKFILRFELP